MDSFLESSKVLLPPGSCKCLAHCRCKASDWGGMCKRKQLMKLFLSWLVFTGFYMGGWACSIVRPAVETEPSLTVSVTRQPETSNILILIINNAFALQSAFSPQLQELVCCRTGYVTSPSPQWWSGSLSSSISSWSCYSWKACLQGQGNVQEQEFFLTKTARLAQPSRVPNTSTHIYRMNLIYEGI